MTVEFNLPDIGEGLNEAEVINWLVAVGDTVERNQPFVEIMTDKSTVEMPAPAAGTVRKLGVDVGEIVQVGELLVIIDDGNTAETSGADITNGGAPDAPAATPTPTSPEPGAHSPLAHATAVEKPSRRPKASPSTRKLAAELGIDLTTVTGTGPGGRILAEDIHQATTQAKYAPVSDGFQQRPPAIKRPIETPSAIPQTAQLEPGEHRLRGVRRATAKAMDLSWSTIPHISAANEINAENLLSARAQLRALQDPSAPNITPLVIAIMAVARALRRVPVMNATLDLEAETVTVHDRVNIGVAVATDYGLLVPVIADADELDVFAMAAELGRLTSASRARAIDPADLQDGTYTITNFGSQGTTTATPIIRPGESGIAGLGSIAPRPIVVDGQVVAKPTMSVVVCGDHRLVDGDVMSAFHGDICVSLEAPLGLLL